MAVLGAGTVGREVVRGLLDADARDRLTPADGVPLRLVGVAVRDVEAARARGIPGDLLSDTPAHLVAAPDTDVVVELLGGDEPARTLVTAALSAGKAVVTANKHVVAHHGPELEAISRRAGAPLRFEAAVGGGIPVLGPLAGDLAANRVTRVRGIVNGTTNHILSEMVEGRGTYDAVLRDAQERGYAEADPSGDVEGRDAINKIVILARLAFGAWLDPAAVPDRPASLRGRGSPGITGVTAPELAGAKSLGLMLRLIASATPDAAGVIPTAVPLDTPLGGTSGVRNRIEISGEPVGTVGFDGPGAGGGPTSSAVLGDLVALARGAGSTWAGRPAAGLATLPAPAGDEASGRWFAFVPGIAAGQLVRALAEDLAENEAGVAIRTRPITLADLRSCLLEVTLDALDPQLYAIDD
ncbi:MAG TPA: homoserine dehydrogenase [Candidatus Limnocylindrales bacterium]|nr:homoserine dehydrogenase [Candidatus Limnocylindrales bacterium]